MKAFKLAQRVTGLVLLCAVVLGTNLGASPAQAARDIKIGHAFPNTHPMHQSLVLFADEVKRDTKGELTFTVVHSGVLGGEAELIQQMLGGMLESVFIGGINAFQGYVPQAAVEDLPFMFKDAQAAHAAIDGDFGRHMATDYLEPLGFKVVTYLEQGFRQITNSKRPIATPSDLSGLKLRVPPLPVRIEVFKLFGATPVPMALPELFAALQQKTVDGQENPLATIESFKFYDVQKYLSLVNHTYTSGLLLIHKAVWDKLSDAQRTAVLAAGERAKKFSRELNASQEKKALERIRAAGVQVNEADHNAFAAKVKPVWDNFKAKHGSTLLDYLPKN